MKTCTKCQQEKALEAFGPEPRNRDGRLSHCRACRSAYQKHYSQKPHAKKAHADYLRRKLYGIPPEIWESATVNGCAACGSRERLAVDHDHSTGALRGPLCIRCNRALGLLGDSPDRILGLLAYALATTGKALTNG